MTIKRVCAWCKKVMEEGSEPVTHGICRTCSEEMMELHRRRPLRVPSWKKGLREKRGFSLIEVLIGLIVLAVGLLAIAGLQITSVLGNFTSKNLTQATYALQDRLEVLEGLPYDSPQLQPGEYDEDPVPLSGTVFNRSYNVVVNENLKTIQYRVTWNDGASHRISFSTVRSQ